MYESLVELFESSGRKFGDSTLCGAKRGGNWRWITYGDVEEQVKASSTALAELGVEIGDRVAMVPDNCVEWAVAAYGPNVMQGYQDLPEETAAVLTDGGGFRTGNLGRLDSDGYQTITGRLKERCKLENGKCVSPEPLEEQMKLSPFVSNVMLFGADKPFNIALVVLDAETLQAWARKHGVTVDGGNSDEAVNRLLLSELVKHSECRGYERPKKVGVMSEDLTLQNEMLTPSLEIKRRKVVGQYQSLIDSPYGSA